MTRSMLQTFRLNTFMLTFTTKYEHVADCLISDALQLFRNLAEGEKVDICNFLFPISEREFTFVNLLAFERFLFHKKYLCKAPFKVRPITI